MHNKLVPEQLILVETRSFMNKIRFSIRNKILIGNIIINLLIIICTCLVIYNKVSTSYTSTATQNTIETVKVTSSTLNGNLLNIIDLDSSESYACTVLQESLKQLITQTSSESVYILAERDGKYYYLIDSDGNTAVEVESEFISEIQRALNGDSFSSDQIEQYKGASVITYLR